MFSLDEYRALRDGAGIIDRSDRVKIVVTGNDRAGWLQGLVTNDVAALAAGRGCYAAHLTPQGRMISDMRIVETGDAIHLDLEPFLRPTILARLDGFIFAEDVRLEDQTDTHALVGVHGPRAAAALSELIAGAATDATAERLTSLDEYSTVAAEAFGEEMHIIASRDFGEVGFDLLVRSHVAERVRTGLRALGAIDVGVAAAETARVEAGRPRFGVDMDEDTIPLEAGIEDRAVSFTKGCYVGQEVVIRILHRGHGRVARRLVGIAIQYVNAESYTPLPGDPIEVDGKPTGRVTSGVYSPMLGRPIALGYVQRDFADAGRELIIVSHGHRLPAVVTKLGTM